MFLELHLFNKVTIKVQWRVWCFLYFATKNNLLHLLVGIRVQSHFPFKLIADKFILSTTEKGETSFSKSLAFVEAFWRIVYIHQNNNGLRTDPCGTHNFIPDHEDSWAFNTVFFLCFKMSVKVLKSFPDIPFCFNLKIGPFCQTLSKVFGDV